MAEFNIKNHSKSRGKPRRSFDRRDAGGSRRRDPRRPRRRDSEKITMHKVICDKCKKECEVPFKPSSDKPVYCDDCFKENRPSKDSNLSRRSNPDKEFKEINKKLDKILELLK